MLTRLYVRTARNALRTTGARCIATSSNPSGLPQPRLDYRALANNIDTKSHNANLRKAALPHDAIRSIADLYAEQKELAKQLNTARYERSLLGETIQKSSGDKEAMKHAVGEAKRLKKEVAELEKKLDDVEHRLFSLAVRVPNDTHPEVPIGSESHAKVLSQHGPAPIPATPDRDHLSVARQLDLLDLEAAATVTGSSWYYLKNEGALLEMALTNYAMSLATARGFRPVMTPDVVRVDIASRCGFQPRDPMGDPPVSQMYHIANTILPQSETGSLRHPELVLAGTAEIPLAGMFANKVLQENELPVKVVGLGHAFRAEAGARGADTRGLYRVHQFTKLELFVVSTEEQSAKIMEDMRALQTEIFEGLGLTFRVLDMPTEELGASAYRKYDMEAWMPGRGNWGEISSASNCTDYQARRLHIRYRKPAPPEMDPEHPPHTHATHSFAHTLNGTAVAVPRLIVALLENGARFNEAGEVVGIDLPKVLKPFWVGGTGRDIVRWV